MPNKKNQRNNIRWSSKNQLYLRRLGLVDQHGHARKVTETTVNEFINECVTIVCESGMHSRASVASSDDLRKSWAVYQIRRITKELEPLLQERQRFKEQMTEEELLAAIR